MPKKLLANTQGSMALAATRPEALLPSQALAGLDFVVPDMYANLRMNLILPFEACLDREFPVRPMDIFHNFSSYVV